MAGDKSLAEEWIPTGGVEIKGKGVMETYLYKEYRMQELSAQQEASIHPQDPTTPGPGPSVCAGGSTTTNIPVRALCLPMD